MSSTVTTTPIIPIPVTTTPKANLATIQVMTLPSAAYSCVEILEQSANNWPKWKSDVTAIFQCSGLGGYLGGTILEPCRTTDPVSAHNWTMNNEIILGFFRLKTSIEEHTYIAGKTTAQEAWLALIKRYEQSGPMHQIALLDEAFAIRYHPSSTRLEVTTVNILEAACKIFAMGIFDHDTFVSLIMLNAMSDELSHVRAHVVSSISNNSSYSYEDIRKRLVHEQQYIDNDNRRAGEPAALAATSKKHQHSHSNGKVCSNCGKPGHSSEDCWQEGGAMEGKREEVLAKKRKKKEAASTNSKPTPTTNAAPAPTTLYDKTGQAYLVSVNSGLTVTAPIPDASQAFAGLASDALSHSFIDNFAKITEIPDDNYSLVSVSNVLETSIDWSTSDTSTSSAFLSLTAEPFFLDTGASTHISPVRKDFSNFHSISPRPIKGVGGSTIMATGMGCVDLTLGNGHVISLANVLFVPNATVRLISVGNLCGSSALTAHFNATSCWLTTVDGSLVASGRRGTNRNLYTLEDESLSVKAHAYLSRSSLPITTWHHRLGHVNFRAISDMARKGIVEGMHVDPSSEPPPCEHCILGKQVKCPLPKVREGLRATKRLEIVHVDLTGPMAVRSASGNAYILDIIDDCTSFIWSIPIPSKSAALPSLIAWEKAREIETGSVVGTYRLDNGELKSNAMHAWAASRGTRLQFTAPYTSGHNGRVERTHLTLANRARSMRLQTGLPPNRWDKFFVTACYLSVRSPTRSLINTTPYECWHGHKPDLSHLREIGSRAFVLIQKDHNPKIYARSIECVLIGYSSDSKAYRCYHHESNKVLVSFNVRFIESHEGTPSLPSAQPTTPAIPLDDDPRHPPPVPEASPIPSPLPITPPATIPPLPSESDTTRLVIRLPARPAVPPPPSPGVLLASVNVLRVTIPKQIL